MLDAVLSSIFSEAFLATLVRVSIPLLFAALSAYISALGGIPNIAVEGTMLISALFAVLGGAWSGSAVVGMLCAVAVGIAFSMILPLATIRLGTDPILVGIALNTFSSSITVFLLYMLTGNKGTSASIASPVLPIVEIPVIRSIPILRSIFSGQYTIAYLCFAMIVFLAVLVYKTPLGLRIKAAGLSEEAARSVGVDVDRVRIVAIVLSGLLASLGGAYMTLGYLSSFTKDMIAGRGWIGIASQCIGGANLLIVTVTAVVFSFFEAISNMLSIYDFPSEVVQVIPYLAVFLGFSAITIIKFYQKKRKGE